jgi:uncharacterized protein
VKTFFIKLIPPRPSFAQDMSEREATAMREHAAYWRSKMADGKVVAFGPVSDPSGTYGIGIIQVEDDQEARSFMEHDPAIRTRIGLSYELGVMPQGVIQPEAKAPGLPTAAP